MNTCSCIIVIFINTALVKYGGDMAVGAYGIANRIGFLFFMIVMGINQGMQPIAGYNYGAMHFDRMLKVLKLSMISATAIMAVGWLVGELMPYPCARLFTTDAELIEQAVKGIRLNMIAFPLIGSQAVITNFFQSIGKAKISIFLSLSRQMIFLLPLLVALPPMLGVDGVWYALPTSDTVAFIVTWIIMIRYMRKFKLQHQKQIYAA
jgi:Na+-driven multidrug efflux pump